MRALKAAVIVMGVLIVAGFAFVVITIAGRVSGGDPGDAIGDLKIDVDPACRMADAWSADGLLFLRLSGPEVCDLVLLVNPKSGRQVGQIGLGQSSAPVE